MAYETPAMPSFGGQYPVRTFTAELTVPTGQTSASVTSATKFRGTIEKIEIDPGAALAENAKIQVYEANTELGSTARDLFLDYTVPASAAETVIYPMAPVADNTGAAITSVYTKYVLNDALTVALSNATAGDSVAVKVYVRG